MTYNISKPDAEFIIDFLGQQLDRNRRYLENNKVTLDSIPEYRKMIRIENDNIINILKKLEYGGI